MNKDDIKTLLSRFSVDLAVFLVKVHQVDEKTTIADVTHYSRLWVDAEWDWLCEKSGNAEQEDK